jgi:hypothetical protein
MGRKYTTFARNMLIFLIILATAARPEMPGAAQESGRPVRIAYIEGGFYTDYASILVALAQGLAELGVLANGNVPARENADSTEGIWQWLCANAG